MYSFQSGLAKGVQKNNRIQVQSLDSQKYQKRISNTCNQDCYLPDDSEITLTNHSHHLYQSKKHTEKRRSLTNSYGTMASTINDSSFLSKKTDIKQRRGEAKENYSHLDKKNFSCPYCSNNKFSSCSVCKGSSKIKEDCALINFFSYIVQFKTGVVQSYSPSQQKCKLEQKKSLTKTTKPCRSQKLSIVERKNEFQNIHYGYFCNVCNDFNAIKGPRFACPICQDFDLCQRCYKYEGHHHMMKQIEKSANYKFSISCLQRMGQKNEQMNTEIRKTRQIDQKLCKLQQKFFSSSIQ